MQYIFLFFLIGIWLFFQISYIIKHVIDSDNNMSCCEKDHNNGHQHEEMIQGQTEEDRLRLKKARLQRKRIEMIQMKKKYLPLVKFLKKNGLKFKIAGTQTNSIQYFRVDKFKTFLQQKKQTIEANLIVSELLKNWQKIFLYYQRFENQPNLKWPQQLQISNKGSQSKFASFPFDCTESSRVKSILILLVVIAAVLFPLWPFELKYFLWLISYYLTMILVGTIAVRLAIYLFFSIFGGSLWIFPKLFDNVEFLQSFKPFCQLTWWEGSNIYSIVTRLIVLSLFCYYGFHIYSDPQTFKKNIQITKTIMDDINDWGVSKIKGEKNFSQSALTDYSKLLNQTLENDETEEIENEDDEYRQINDENERETQIEQNEDKEVFVDLDKNDQF